MNSDRRMILSLIASGRITAAEGERLILVASDSRETAWIVGFCLLAACLAQVHLREFATGLVHLLNAQILVLAGGLGHVLSPVTDLLGGLL